MIHCYATASPLSQVARTITNMQQQIQQHQRQLYQALLMKQQQLPSHSSSSSSSSAGLHPPGGPAGGPVSGKSTLDPFTGPHQATGHTDTLHTKEPPSSPNAYSTYPLCESGMGSTSNSVNPTQNILQLLCCGSNPAMYTSVLITYSVATHNSIIHQGSVQFSL